MCFFSVLLSSLFQRIAVCKREHRLALSVEIILLRLDSAVPFSLYLIDHLLKLSLFLLDQIVLFLHNQVPFSLNLGIQLPFLFELIFFDSFFQFLMF